MTLDQKLREALLKNNIQKLEQMPEPEPAKVELGRMLFHDKILSGNKDIACATCHHPKLKSGDELALPIGVGGKGLGQNRIMGEEREPIPRNSPEIFNRGSSEWHTMFWDSRVAGNLEEGWYTPADAKFPKQGFDNILAVQAMFPVTSRDEMRGEIGDLDVHGQENELALISPAMPQSIWFAIMQRLIIIPEYVDLFKAAYPDIAIEDLSFVHAANALAAYEISAFTYLDSPWDKYLAGDENALNEQQKRGAFYFYQKNSCVNCHGGNLMTDQEVHNIGIPKFGPGKDSEVPIDYGHIVESGNPEDLLAFRTPPLRNVALTGPWMHNGAYNNLEAVIRHHMDPASYLQNYDIHEIPEELHASYQDDERLIGRIIETLDLEAGDLQASDQDIQDLLAFMDALTEEGAKKRLAKVPKSVPSGLPVDE